MPKKTSQPDDAGWTSLDPEELAKRAAPSGPEIDRAREKFGTRRDWSKPDADYLIAELLHGAMPVDAKIAAHVFGAALNMTLAVRHHGDSHAAVRGVLFGIWQLVVYLLHPSNEPVSTQARKALAGIADATEFVAAAHIDELVSLLRPRKN